MSAGVTTRAVSGKGSIIKVAVSVSTTSHKTGDILNARALIFEGLTTSGNVNSVMVLPVPRTDVPIAESPMAS